MIPLRLAWDKHAAVCYHLRFAASRAEHDAGWGRFQPRAHARQTAFWRPDERPCRLAARGRDQPGVLPRRTPRTPNAQGTRRVTEKMDEGSWQIANGGSPTPDEARVFTGSPDDSATDGATNARPWPAGFKLTIVIPVYNEQQTVAEILRRVRDVPVPKEIIVVDDCSTDGTRAELEQLTDWPELRVIYQARNAGKGAALRTGFAAATGDVVVVQDADLEYDPRDLPRLLEPILDGTADVVYGSRYLHEEPQDPSRIHRWGNFLLTWASNLCTGLRLTDMETCYKMIPRPLLQSLNIQQNRFGFEPEVTAKLARRGVRITELPVRYESRGYKEGKKIGWRDGVNALYCIVRYRWRD